MTSADINIAHRWILRCLFLFAAYAAGAAQAGERVTYYVPNALGSPIAAMDEQGNVLWRESYTPHGERRAKSAGNDAKTAYTGKPEDRDTGLVYLGARWYDPETGRFTGIDPKGFDEANVQSVGRYVYANNSPYRFSDPDGESPKEVFTDLMPQAGQSFAALAAYGVGLAGGDAFVQRAALSAMREMQLDGLLAIGSIFAPSGAEEIANIRKASKAAGNNPYEGSVEEAVIVVDKKGNAILVRKGERLSASPDGDYQQVLGNDGKPTGLRMDRGGHRGQSDPAAKGPHGHVPGITRDDGNPHLPLYDQ